MGNVIGLTLSRTGIVIGRLLNAQLRSLYAWLRVCALRGGINYFYFGTDTLSASWFYKVRWNFPSHFPSLLNTLLMPVHILLLLSFTRPSRTEFGHPSLEQVINSRMRTCWFFFYLRCLLFVIFVIFSIGSPECDCYTRIIMQKRDFFKITKYIFRFQDFFILNFV